ncbi:hypothetical protein WKW77_07745 [Variovorax ureilyticus]|uniref:Uncharacterized protein n=1 Tax=Variovorax ureilyticus TaxID=1836198 RepID=A0ABU8VBC6_9BURK
MRKSNDQRAARDDMAGVFEDPQTRHREIELHLPHRASPMLGEHSATNWASTNGNCRP